MKPWAEVEADPQFQTLSPADQTRAQNQYFEDVVSPQLEEQDRESARNQFFSEFGRSYLPEDSGQGPVESAVNTGIQSLAKVGTGTVEGLGQFSQSYIRNLNPVGWAAHAGVPGAQSLVDTFSQPGKYVEELGAGAQESVEETIPSNPLLEDTILQKGAGVAGQVAGQLGTVLTGAAVTKAPKILQALGLGQAGILGLESGYADADKYGVTGWERDALAASYAAAEAGVEGMGGFGSPTFTKALLGEVREALGKGAGKRFLKTVGAEGVEEPITGTAQAGAANVFAEEDPQRPGYTLNGEKLPNVDPTTAEFWEDRVEEAALGAAGGSLFGAAAFAGSRPSRQQKENTLRKIDLTLAVLGDKPDQTPEEQQELAQLAEEGELLRADLQTEVVQDETAITSADALVSAAQTAQEAGMPETAAMLEAIVPPQTEISETEIQPIETPTDAIAEIPEQIRFQEEREGGDQIRQEAVTSGSDSLLSETTSLPQEVVPLESAAPAQQPTESVVQPQPTQDVQAPSKASQNPAVAKARVVVDSKKATLPSAAEAWVGTREEMLADPAIRQAFIQNERAIDPDLTEQQASEIFDLSMGNPLMDGVTFGGRTYIIADGVSPTAEDGSFEGAIERILRHEDTHISIDSVTQSNPKRKKEWEGLKKRVSPEKLDNLAKRRYPMFTDWRKNGDSFDSLAHEYFAEQMERDAAGETVDDRPLLEQFIAYMKKVLARVTGREVSLEEIREFVRAGREARTKGLQTGSARASSQGLSKEATERDADYMAAVERGDMETAQKMVDDSLPPTPKMSKGLSDEVDQAIQGSHDSGEIISRWDALKQLIEDYNDKDLPAYEFREELRKIQADLGVLEPYTKEQVDRIVVTGGKKYEFKKGDIFYVFNSWKKFPSLNNDGTYDDQGNVIPLSQRFNTRKSDIRFSLKEGVPLMPKGSAGLITHKSPYPGMTSEKIVDYAWPRFYSAWKSNLENPDAPLTSAQQAQLEAEWKANLADENAMEIAADNAYSEERMSRADFGLYSPEPSQTAPETGPRPTKKKGKASEPTAEDIARRFPRFSLKPSYGSQSEERTEDYKEAEAAMPESGKEYVQFLGKLTRTPKEIQAVRPMVDFARSLLGSYQGDEIEVNADNTERVKELAAQAFQKGKPGAQFAEYLSQQFRDSGFSNNGQHQGSVAAGVLQMEILDYAVRLAGTGDKSLALALMPYANDVAAADHASVSNAGRALQMRSMAGQQKGFWTILNSLAKGERELAEKNPIYKELREALFSDDVRAETAAGVEKDVASAEGQKALNPTESPEDLLDTYLGRALGIMDQAERDITIKLFNDLAELELLLTKQYEMQVPKGAKASMQAARDMNDPVAIQERIAELKKSISGGLKALDQFKTSEATKEARQKAINKTPRAKKEISADAQAKKMLDRLENKEKRTKKEAPAWKKTYTDQIKTPKTEAEFATEMASHGVSAETATKLYEEAKKSTRELQDAKDAAERRKADRKETQEATSEAKERVRDQKRDMDRPGKIADQKSFINEVMRQIFSGTLEEQADPNWRRMVMVEAFKKEGFSQGSAENAADYLGDSLDRNLKQAQEKAAHKAAKDLKMKKPTLEKLVKAIRSRAIDPLNTDPVTKALAAEAGFAGITPEQFTELAKLDGQMRGPYQSQRAKAAARMLDIALAAKPPKGRLDILTQAWISSALSSVSTMSLSAVHAAFIPVRRLVTDFAGIAMDVSTGKTKPADAAQLMVNTMGNMQESAKYMLATAKFAGLNDAYTQHIVEFINQMHSMQADLQRAVQVIKDPKSTGIEKGKAAIKIAFTSTDIVRRILSTADETWGSMLQDFVLRNEAMRTLVQKGRMSPEQAALLFVKASNDGRAAGEQHFNETGNRVEAQLVERDATQNAILQVVREVAGEGSATDVGETASLESPMELGNRRSEDAPLADVFNTGLEWVKQLAIATRRKNELAGRMITGFVTVPANILNRSAYFSPVGLIRALYKMGKIGGDPEKIRQAYEETMKTEGQQRMRLIEGIVGTMLIAMLIALKPDDDEEGLVITGSGPEDRGLREAWLKKGNRPNTIQWVDNKGNVRFSVPYARGGFDHLNLPFTLVGTMDDMKLKGIKPQPANVEWGTQYAHTMLKGLFDQAKFFGLKNVAAMPTQNLTDKSLASQAAYLAAPVMPWSGFTKSLGRMWTGPTDQSSVQSAVLAQLPFTNFFADPSLNALGDQRGPAPSDAAWDRALMTGVPWTVGAKDKGPDADLYDFMIDKGVAPNVPLRSNIERKNGLITDSRWKEYLQTRGKLVKQGIRKNLRELKKLPYQDAQNLMEKLSGDATKAAKAKLKLE
jgi:hypothetical protein